MGSPDLDVSKSERYMIAKFSALYDTIGAILCLSDSARACPEPKIRNSKDHIVAWGPEIQGAVGLNMDR